MRVIESFCQGKRADQDLCEDAVFVSEHFVAVIDGVSDKNGLDYGGMTGGRWAALTVADELARLPPDATLVEAEKRLTFALASGQDALHASWTDAPPAGATFVCYSRAKNELWRIGDGHYAINGVAHQGSMKIDEIAVAMRWAYIECLRQAGLSDEEIAKDSVQAGELVRPLLAVQHHLANLSERHPLAYSVLNGHQVPEHLQEVIALKLGVREVAMSSDGYPRLFATLAETERYLAEDVNTDPLRAGRHRGFIAVQSPLLSFDDRSYVRLAID